MMRLRESPRSADGLGVRLREWKTKQNESKLAFDTSDGKHGEKDVWIILYFFVFAKEKHTSL